MSYDRNNDPVVAMAKVLGKLYYFMAKEVIDAYGEKEGKEVIRRAIWKFGANRGANIRKKVLENGEELNFENFEKFYDIPLNNAWDADSEATDTSLREVTRYCPYADAWKELGGEELGYIYCEQDIAMAKAYNDKVEFERPSNLMDGENALCEMILKLKK